MRLSRATIIVSLASLPFIVPHVVEDFAEGIASRIGLSTGALAFLLGGYLAAQALGLVLLAERRRAGWIVTLVIGLIWVTGAVVDHGSAVLSSHFRSGALSVLWVVGLVVTQTMALVLASLGLRSGR